MHIIGVSVGVTSFLGLPFFLCSSVFLSTETKEQKKRGRPGDEASVGVGYFLSHN